MKVFLGSKSYKPGPSPVVTLGVFDGVHVGHRHIFQQVIRRAKKIRGTSVVYTFDPHPAKILAPDSSPLMLNTLTQKIELIAAQGIQHMIIETFTKAYAHQTPEKFFDQIILKRLKASELLVGYDFTFGVHRSGTMDRLHALTTSAGIRLSIIEPYLKGEALASSTQIRQLLARGHTHKAQELLGRPYFVEGRVVRGKGIGGRELGLHTANIHSENDALLPTGVYATHTRVGGKHYKSVTNIGPNPTFGLGPLSIETHIFQFDKNIVGQKIRIEFLEKIREEITFSSAHDLSVQIQRDIQWAKKYFTARKTS